jgi:hypothetical protein
MKWGVAKLTEMGATYDNCQEFGNCKEKRRFDGAGVYIYIYIYIYRRSTMQNYLFIFNLFVREELANIFSPASGKSHIRLASHS